MKGLKDNDLFQENLFRLNKTLQFISYRYEVQTTLIYLCCLDLTYDKGTDDMCPCHKPKLQNMRLCQRSMSPAKWLKLYVWKFLIIFPRHTRKS